MIFLTQTYAEWAKYLDNPFVLYGFIAMLITSVLFGAIKTGVIKRITGTSFEHILTKLLKYGFVLILLSIIFGFITSAFNLIVINGGKLKKHKVYILNNFEGKYYGKIDDRTYSVYIDNIEEEKDNIYSFNYKLKPHFSQKGEKGKGKIIINRGNLMNSDEILIFFQSKILNLAGIAEGIAEEKIHGATKTYTIYFNDKQHFFDKINSN